MPLRVNLADDYDMLTVSQVAYLLEMTVAEFDLWFAEQRGFEPLHTLSGRRFELREVRRMAMKRGALSKDPEAKEWLDKVRRSLTDEIKRREAA
jgi:hypothetical protein